MPKQESFVETPEGVGTVSAVNLLREQVKVRLDDTPDTPKTFHSSEICVVRSGKGKRPEGYVPPPPEELAKLRKVTPIEEPRTLSGSVNQALTSLWTLPVEDESAGPGVKNRRPPKNRSRAGTPPPHGKPLPPERPKDRQPPAPKERRELEDRKPYRRRKYYRGKPKPPQ